MQSGKMCVPSKPRRTCAALQSLIRFQDTTCASRVSERLPLESNKHGFCTGSKYEPLRNECNGPIHSQALGFYVP